LHVEPPEFLPELFVTLNDIITVIESDIDKMYIRFTGNATQIQYVMNGELIMAEAFIMVRLPSDLVQRAEAQWDKLMENPAFRAAAPRRSGAAAVRMLLQ
jgi:hypothetical protein